MICKEYKRYHTVNGLSWKPFKTKDTTVQQMRYDDYPPELLTVPSDDDDLDWYSDFYGSGINATV